MLYSAFRDQFCKTRIPSPLTFPHERQRSVPNFVINLTNSLNTSRFTHYQVNIKFITDATMRNIEIVY